MKIAARLMLPLEICCGLISVMIGLAASIADSAVWQSLKALKPWLGQPQNEWWGLVLIVVGLILSAIALYELMFGRHWGHETIHVFADMRCISALFLVIAHTSLFTTLMIIARGEPGFTFAWLAPMVAFFSGWSAWFTRRLSVCLNPRYDTAMLERRIHAARD